MSVETFAELYYWGRVVVVVVAVLLAVLLARRHVRPDRFGPVRAMLRALAMLMGLWWLVWVVDAPFDPVYAAVAFGAGVVGGVLLGLRSRGFSPVVGLVAAVALVLAVTTLLFGSLLLVGAAELLWAAAAGLTVGAAVDAVVSGRLTHHAAEEKRERAAEGPEPTLPVS